jgi:hypothetical protein
VNESNVMKSNDSIFCGVPSSVIEIVRRQTFEDPALAADRIRVEAHKVRAAAEDSQLLGLRRL